MTAITQLTQTSAVLAVVLANQANTTLLKQMLGTHFHVQENFADDNDETAAKSVDLIIADVALLKRHYRYIQCLREQAAPLILPVLLVVDSRLRISPIVTNELGRSVDDILRIPTTQRELMARIHNLLRLRRSSYQQENSRKQLASVVSALRTLTVCDQIIARSKTEDEMLNALCQTIASEADYTLAWIGFAVDVTSPRIEIQASAGADIDFLSGTQPSWLDELAEARIVNQAISSGRPYILDDIVHEASLSHLAESLEARGLRSVITLPLIPESGPRGCLTIYSKHHTHFGLEECQLLERLADNLVFGLNALRALRAREQHSADVYYLAHTDSLTGLPNRRHLVHYLNSVLEVSKLNKTSGAVLFIDLDRFKVINDALGHEVGDQVLIQVGQRLLMSVRHMDQVIRHGGDEFLVLMVDENREGGFSTRKQIIDNAYALSERIIAHIKTPLTVEGFAHHLSASIGISLYPDHGNTATTLIENADKAMFEAKRQGGGFSLLFSEDLSINRQQRFALEARLRQALEKKEFELYYQPIFELGSCRIVATEALIRWPQSNGEILMPGAFMQVLEESGMIKPVGDWILETAAKQLGIWHSQGHRLSMAVNVSLNQIGSGSVAEKFSALVRPYVDPSWIHLEVTENALMVDPKTTEALLEELRNEGFQLAIDDFGTGYSSLSRLQHLSIQTLKIDRSFINEIDKPDSKGAALVTIIQQMAAILNLHTIAEGIETEEQHQLLLKSSSSNCWGQGFWFSRAVPAHEVEVLLKNQNQSEV